MSKNSWPELVGLSAEEARAALEAHEENVKVEILPAGPDGKAPKDLTTVKAQWRVRVYIDSEGKVVEAPKRG
jgi:hypothetical protein